MSQDKPEAFTYMQSGTDTSDDELWFVYPDDPELPDGDMGPYDNYFKADAALKAWNSFLLTKPTLAKRVEYVQKHMTQKSLVNYQDNPEKLLERFITEWVHENFGMSEAYDPCYNLEELALYLHSKFTFTRRSPDENVEQRDPVSSPQGEETP